MDIFTSISPTRIIPCNTISCTWDFVKAANSRTQITINAIYNRQSHKILHTVYSYTLSINNILVQVKVCPNHYEIVVWYTDKNLMEVHVITVIIFSLSCVQLNKSGPFVLNHFIANKWGFCLTEEVRVYWSHYKVFYQSLIWSIRAMLYF